MRPGTREPPTVYTDGGEEPNRTEPPDAAAAAAAAEAPAAPMEAAAAEPLAPETIDAAVVAAATAEGPVCSTQPSAMAGNTVDSESRPYISSEAVKVMSTAPRAPRRAGIPWTCATPHSSLRPKRVSR